MLARSRSFIDLKIIVPKLSESDCTDPRHVEVFEKQFATMMGAPQCYATNQGRAALLIALKSLGVGRGDEVIVQSFTYHGVINAILETGATAVLVDSSLSDLNADAAAIDASITEKTRAIIATHLFGIPSDIKEIAASAGEKNIYLIEDCAQCLGGAYRGVKTGIYGDMSIFSFNYEKHLTTGEGGMLCINRKELVDSVSQVVKKYERMPLFNEQCYVYGLIAQHIAFQKDMYDKKLTAYFGQTLCMKSPAVLSLIEDLVRKEASEEEMNQALTTPIKEEIRHIYSPSPIQRGFNLLSRIRNTAFRVNLERIDSAHLLMNSMRAILGTIGLSTLEKVNDIRNRNAAHLAEAFQSHTSYIVPIINENKNPVFLKYNILNETKFSLPFIMQKAREEGMELGNFQWPQPVHLMDQYSSIFSQYRGNLKNCEYIAKSIINLPVHYYVTENDLHEMVEFLHNI